MPGQNDIRQFVICTVDVRGGHVERLCQQIDDLMGRLVDPCLVATDACAGSFFVDSNGDTQLVLGHPGSKSGGS